jgi:hypothetical protein
MAGIVFPSIANALVPLMQMDQQKEQLSLQRQDRADNLAFRKEEADYRHKHLDEQRAMRVQSHLATMDEKKRAMVQDFAKFRVQAGGAVLAAPPEQRPQAYAMYVEEAKRRNYDMSLFPQQWDPSTERRLQFDVDQSIPWADRPQAMPAPGGGAPAPGGAPGGTEIDRASGAISGIESVGQPNGGYGAIGPQTKQGRAYGKHQVMDFNVGPWTAEVLGKAMTPQEFLANPQAQDAVFKAKFGQLAQKYGPEGAARAWFAGEGGMNNPNASDVNGMTVSRYAEKFNKGFGGPQVADAGGFTPTNMPAQNVPGGLTQMPAQGDAVAGQGDVMTPPRAASPSIGNEVDNLRKQTRANGGDIYSVNSSPEIKDGHYVVRSLQDKRQVVGMIPVKPKEQGAGGLFPGSSVEANALNQLIARGILTEQQALELAAGKSITDPSTQQLIFKRPQELVGGANAPAAPAGAAPVAGASTSGVPLTPVKKDPAVKKLETEIRAVESSIANFQKVITEAGGGSWRAFINDPTSASAQKVLGAHNAMKTALRSEAFINTGVLQPAEMKMLDDMLLSPQSVRGYLATPEAYAAMLGQVSLFVKNKMEAAGIAYGQPGAGGDKPPPTTGADGPRLSPEQAAKLRPGTPFVGEDGMPRVRN